MFTKNQTLNNTRIENLLKHILHHTIPSPTGVEIVDFLI